MGHDGMQLECTVSLTTVQIHRDANDRQVGCNQGEHDDGGPLPARQAVTDEVPGKAPDGTKLGFQHLISLPALRV